ncbi:MAG: hypothetical protein AAGF12_29490 [Myxococcota bacterium]
MDVRNLLVPHRYRGPKDSANGGYICGLVAQEFEEAVEVTLRAPPPLDTSLALNRNGLEGELHAGDALVATVRAGDASTDVPAAPTLSEAEAASRRYEGATNHALPECFVCGPHREAGDGLRIFPGPTSLGSLVACAWTPAQEFADESNKVRPEVIWAALDCPGYFGLRRPGVLALLGRMTARVIRSPVPEEPCIVTGWHLETDGRKSLAGAALFAADGELLANSKTTWIEIAKPK